MDSDTSKTTLSGTSSKRSYDFHMNQHRTYQGKAEKSDIKKPRPRPRFL